MGQALSQNTINNFDGNSVIEVTADTIERDAARNTSINYRIMGDVIVQGTDGAEGITTWTIGAGSKIRMDRYRRIIVDGYSGAHGALKARGTATTPIAFTSNEASPVAGDWYHINFLTTTDDATTRMEHCLVEYGGYSQGALNLNNASSAIANTHIR